MFHTIPILIAGGLLLASTVASTASAADMVENYQPPRHVRVIHHVHHVRHLHHIRHHHHRPVRVAYVRREPFACGQEVYEYRTDPPHTEIKTMCGPKPIVYDTAVLVQR